MEDSVGLPPDKYEAEQELWDVHNRILLERGFDFNQLLLQYVQKQKGSYRDPRASIEFDELCDHGCVPQVLSVLLSFVRHSPKLAALWNILVGNSESRRALTKSFENAAAVLELTFRDLIASEDDEQRKAFQEIGRIPLSVMVAELRLYVSMVNLAEKFKIEVETRSPEEFARFLLTDYVKKSTGRFHDRNVATLFGEVMGLEVYDETAQRMWRDRNYERLANHHTKLGDLACAMGVVISRRT